MDESGERISLQPEMQYIKSYGRIFRYCATGLSILFCFFGILYFTFMIIAFVDDLDLKYKVLFCLSSVVFVICMILCAFTAITIYFNERGMLPNAPGTIRRFLNMFNLIPKHEEIPLAVKDLPESEAHSASTAQIQDVERAGSLEESVSLPLQFELCSPNLESTDAQVSSAEGSSSLFPSSQFTSAQDRIQTESNLVPTSSEVSELPSGSLTDITPFTSLSDDLVQDKTENSESSSQQRSNETSLAGQSSDSQLIETNTKLRRRRATGDKDGSSSVTSSSSEGSPQQ